jgi:hypothetical protein
MRATVHPNSIKGEQVAPASKSSMQRACAAALLHRGTTTILNPGHSNDDLAALDVIQKLGAVVQIEQSSNEKYNPTSITVHSDGVKPIGTNMNCGESGLGIRMFTPIAALSDQTITIKGEGSLLKRPMHFFGFWGAIAFVLGFSLTAFVLIQKFIALANGMRHTLVADNPLFYLALTMLIVGSQLFMGGFLAEMISRNAPNRNQYEISERIGF